jgi:tetratricopeptide (TPR) repeat protein
MVPLAILMGLGWARAWRALGRRLGVVALVMLAWPVVEEGRSYFARFPHDPAVAVWFRAWDREAGSDLATMASGRRMVLCGSLPLGRYPVERLALFDAEREGRVEHRPGTCGAVKVRKRYLDPWGEVRAVLGESRGAVVFRTVLDIGMEGDALLTAGRPREALAHFRLWSALLAPSTVLEDRAGFAALAAGMPSEAEASFRKALARGPRTAELLDGLAAALFRRGRLKEAEEAVLEGLRIDPANRELGSDLARIRKAREKRR